MDVEEKSRIEAAVGTPGCRIQGYDVVESGCGLTAGVCGQLESVWEDGLQIRVTLLMGFDG